MSHENLLTVFDVAEKDREKWMISSGCAALPLVDLEDFHETEKEVIESNIKVIYGNYELIPLYTSEGVVYINSVYLNPLNDVIGQLTLHERKDTFNKIYIVAKCGLLLQAIIFPMDIINDVFVNALELLGDKTRNGKKEQVRMFTTFEMIRDLDMEDMAHVLALTYLSGATGDLDTEKLTDNEEFDNIYDKFLQTLQEEYNDGLWKLEVHSPVKPGDDLWWVCEEPPFIRCTKKNVKAVCMWEDGEIKIVNRDDGIEDLHERWTCVSEEEAREMFLKMVRDKEIDLEMYFEGITELPEDEMMKKLDDIEALVEYILGDEKDE